MQKHGIHRINKKYGINKKQKGLWPACVGLFFWSFFFVEHNLYHLHKFSQIFIRL